MSTNLFSAKRSNNPTQGDIAERVIKALSDLIKPPPSNLPNADNYTVCYKSYCHALEEYK